jgi:tetratricopeptide (TPR) repeat protein
MTRVFLSLTLVAGLLSASTLAEAQPSDGNRDAAREAFLRGQEAADSGRWADALREFEQAYLMSGVPTALFNAGMALRALGRHKEARDTFDRLIESHPDSAASAQAQPLREEEAARVAVLELAGLDPEGAYELRLDGRRLEVTIAPTLELEVDPGRHGLSAEREGYQTFTWEGQLGDGERERIQIVMTELERPTEPGESSSVLTSPILWIAVAAVVVGGAIGLGVWLAKDGGVEPAYDNVFRF